MIFSPDGSKLAILAADRTVRLWRVEEFDELMAQGCDWVRDYLENSPRVKPRDRTLCDQIGPFFGPALATDLSPTHTLKAAPSLEFALLREAVNKASKAAELNQTANTPGEWSRVATLWQEAIDLLTVLKQSNPNHQTVDQKIVEYRGNLQYAQQNEKVQKQAKVSK